MAQILVTGAAGFIGFHLARRLVAEGNQVLGIDNLNDYYDVRLKLDRLKQLVDLSSFSFQKIDLADRTAMQSLFMGSSFDTVLHLAAQPGVRYSLENPASYIDNNLVGFGNLLEGCRHSSVQHFVYASSGSVYGANTKIPFSTDDLTDHPISLYAATKKSNELLAHSYSHLYSLPTTGLRFFTVYGPWARPDMAIFKFADAILEDRPIEVYNYGKMQRDFTYIDDIVEGVYRVMTRIPQRLADHEPIEPSPAVSRAPYCIFNIGNTQPVELERLISLLEASLEKTAIKEHLPIQPGDLLRTHADIGAIQDAVNYQPSTPIETGIQQFTQWYLWYRSQRESGD